MKDQLKSRYMAKKKIFGQIQQQQIFKWHKSCYDSKKVLNQKEYYARSAVI